MGHVDVSDLDGGVSLKSTKVVIASNSAWSIVNFRAGFIRALLDSGFEVVAVAPPDEFTAQLFDLDCRYLPLPIDGCGTHPGRDLLLMWRFWRLLQRERPDVYLGFTVKPNVYGSLASHVLGIPVINTITGLGVVFMRKNWLTLLVRRLYRLSLIRSKMVFFLNEDDRQLFIEDGLVQCKKTDTLKGEGLNLDRFKLTPISPNNEHRFRFLLICRMLWDKGVGEYVEAARIVKRCFTKADFCLLGFLDVQNPSAIVRSQMDAWIAEGVVRYLGTRDDVRGEIEAADCIVLPSYREGVPRSLLESAAMGRPIITTDAVGCREVVDDGVNGFLCRVRDADDLAKKMERMLALSREARIEMGRRGREKMEREFDERLVIDRYLEVISTL